MSKDDTSFSEFVYGKILTCFITNFPIIYFLSDAFIYNNCRALRVGLTSFHEVLAEDIAALKQN